MGVKVSKDKYISRWVDWQNLICEHVTWGPKWTQTNLKSQTGLKSPTALRSCSVYMANSWQILHDFNSLQAFPVYMENSLWFEISLQIGRSEICTEVSFTSPELVWRLIMKLPYAEVKFYPKVKSQSGLNSLQISCKCVLYYQKLCLAMKKVIDGGKRS